METFVTMPMFLIVLIALLFIGSLAAFLIWYCKTRTLDQIRGDVYQLILKAEHTFKGSEQGKQKMKWVVAQARKLLPEWMRSLITVETLEEIIQIWFDCVKDLLDDGKANGTAANKD